MRSTRAIESLSEALISVVTISFNQLEFLKACVESVAAQAGPYEHIIVDPGSTDGSREYIAANRAHFSQFVLEKDDGPADGLNRGFARATGDIFYYLNSDDIVNPGTFAAVRAAFHENPSADVIYGDGDMIDGDGEHMRHMRSMRKFTARNYHCGGGSVVQQATFFTGEAFRRAGGFNVNNKACWDGELVADLHATGSEFKYIRANWGGFRIHDASISGSNDDALQARWVKERTRMFRTAYGRDMTAMDRFRGKIIRNFDRAARKLGA